MKTPLIGSYVAAILFLFSCNGSNKSCALESATAKKIINPNGDSELALLMREMFDEAFAIKQQISRGEDPVWNLDHSKILTAHATEPEKAASSEFKAFSNAYLASIQQMKSASHESFSSSYQSMISQCRNCHQALCPGPLVRIDKLTLAEPL